MACAIVTTVLLADDHDLVRQGIRLLLKEAGFMVVGEASDGQEALRVARDVSPDIAVLDLMMPVLNGIDAAHEIRQACPRTRSILLTMDTSEEHILTALRAGLKGCVVKSGRPEELVKAIREVVRGGLYLSPSISGAVVQAFLSGAPAPALPLTSRERQVLQLIGEGRKTREVAEVLGVSVKTAESHRSNIMTKLGIRDTAGLVRCAIRHGLAEL